MNKYKTTTRWLIILTMVIWISWDLVAWIKGGEGATESEQIAEFSVNSMPFVFALGFLMGHWLWVQVIYLDKDGKPIKRSSGDEGA
jgi:uncharacterized membrane protein YhdT